MQCFVFDSRFIICPLIKFLKYELVMHYRPLKYDLAAVLLSPNVHSTDWTQSYCLDGMFSILDLLQHMNIYSRAMSRLYPINCYQKARILKGACKHLSWKPMLVWDHPLKPALGLDLNCTISKATTYELIYVRVCYDATTKVSIVLVVLFSSIQ